MNKLDVHLKLTNIHCYDPGDGIGSAEPYLWSVFFKIDGETAFVNADGALQGTATVVSTRGNHRDLPRPSVNAGDDVPVTPALGEFTTQLVPIPLRKPILDLAFVGGVVGAIVVLMEQDATSDTAIAQGHHALDQAVQDSLNGLIPQLGIKAQDGLAVQIEAIKKQIGDTVMQAIQNDVSIWSWLGALGNMDDQIGGNVFRFSHDDLASFGVGGIGFHQRFTNQGDWEIMGRIAAIPPNATTGSLHVAVTGVPNVMTAFPVLVRGPGYSRAVNRTTTLGGVLPGDYTITASEFNTGQINKPGCRMYTPAADSATAKVIAGGLASVAVHYNAGPCTD
jgi:hypothetical protein